MKRFFEDVMCMFGFHEWHQETRRQHVKHWCARCGHEEWELNSW